MVPYLTCAQLCSHSGLCNGADQFRLNSVFRVRRFRKVSFAPIVSCLRLFARLRIKCPTQPDAIAADEGAPFSRRRFSGAPLSVRLLSPPGGFPGLAQVWPRTAARLRGWEGAGRQTPAAARRVPAGNRST